MLDKNEIVELWNKQISQNDQIKKFSAQDLYVLLTPDDENRFFEIINTFEHDIKLLGVRYLIAYKSDQKTLPYVVTYPGTSPTLPYTPSTNPYPWQQPNTEWNTTSTNN